MDSLVSLRQLQNRGNDKNPTPLPINGNYQSMASYAIACTLDTVLLKETMSRTNSKTPATTEQPQ